MRIAAKKITALVMTMIITGSLLTGCDINKIKYPGQQKWVDKMNETFTDDKFTFQGQVKRTFDDMKINIIELESENCPGKTITVEKRDGELYTDYMIIRYGEEIDEYTKEHYTDYFDEDGFEYLKTITDNKYPIEDVPLDEFLDSKLVLKCEVVIYYDGELPSMDEAEEMLMDLAKKDRRACHVTMYIAAEGTEDLPNKAYLYSLDMDTNDHINYLYYNCPQEDGGRTSDYFVQDVDLA